MVVTLSNVDRIEEDFRRLLCLYAKNIIIFSIKIKSTETTTRTRQAGELGSKTLNSQDGGTVELEEPPKLGKTNQET